MARDERQTTEMNALLGKGASFEGKLTFEGTVRIDGNFKGEIHTNDVLVVGEAAKVDAEMTVGMAIVNGDVRGNITAAKAIELNSPAKVRGNLTTPSLYVEKGVLFEGACSMDTKRKEGTPHGATKPQPQGEKK